MATAKSSLGCVQASLSSRKSQMLMRTSLSDIESCLTMGTRKISMGMVEYFLMSMRRLATRTSRTSFSSKFSMREKTSFL